MIRYAFQLPQNRAGELEFLSSTQSNWTKSKAVVLREVEDLLRIADFLVATDDGWRQPTRKEILEELGGEPIVYKLTIERVKLR